MCITAATQIVLCIGVLYHGSVGAPYEKPSIRDPALRPSVHSSSLSKTFGFSGSRPSKPHPLPTVLAP